MPLLVFVLLALLIGAMGYFIFEQNKRAIKESEIENLGAIADLKVAQIVGWRESQKRRVDAFLYGSVMPDEFFQWLRGGALPSVRKQKILRLLIGLQQKNGYKSITLLDRQGVTRILTDPDDVPGSEETKLAMEAMKSRHMLFSDFHRGVHASSEVAIDLAVPLLSGDELMGAKEAVVVGSILIRIDPNMFLYPLIQSWPTRSKTAETLLVRREGDHVLFLNELRFKKGSALSLRIPMTNTKLPSVQAIHQKLQLKSTEGVDYRGVPVAAALRVVPDSSWIMVSKVDMDELLKPIYALQRWVTGLGFAFMVFGGALVLFWFRGQNARFLHLKTQYDAKLERESLSRRYDSLAKFSNDIIFTMDDNANILEANDRAVDIYGYSHEELLSMNARDLRSAEQIPMFDQRWHEIQTRGHLVNESLHRRKDGTTFPAEVSSRRIEANGEAVIQVIIRDITERRQSEEALRKQERFFRQVIDTDPNYILVKSANGKILLVNQAMAALHGKTPQELVGRDDAEMFRNEMGHEAHLVSDREVIKTRRQVMYVTHAQLGGKQRWLLVIKAPMEQPDGTVHVLGIAVDITERKLAEEKLEESYKELQKLATHLEVVREDEQKRIARELHDEMGGVLAALNINVSLLASEMPAEMKHLLVSVDSLAKLVDAGIQTMRHTVSKLRPSLLDYVGLKFAIEQYIEEFQKNTGIECELRLSEDEPKLDANRSAAVFRIIQESLTNVAKHAQASRVNIVLSYWDDSLVLTIKDNGKGFDPTTVKPDSFGLLGIRERAYLLGGRAEIISAAGKGTTVRVGLPKSS